MNIGIPTESCAGERRVAITPEHTAQLIKQGFAVLVQSGAGAQSGFLDEMYTEKGARICPQRKELYAESEMLLLVRGPGANPGAGQDDSELLRDTHILIGQFDPLSNAAAAQDLAARGVTSFAMELMPRITRAQSMDVLSSMATISGYKAVLIAASALPKMFPMMMTAAGTLKPAHALVVGAGVAGLQAIASARRLGAVVSAYDIRPAVKEQIESLGAKFVEMELEAGQAEDKGGYAREMDEEFYRRQRELMTKVVADSDVVITTAAIPGKKSPVLVTAQMVKGMQPGSVIVDLAAERGGNCELTRADETVDVDGVTIFGPTNLPSTVPYHASQMYGKNLITFIRELCKEGKYELDLENEVVRDTLLTRGGEVVSAKVREVLGLESIQEKVTTHE